METWQLQEAKARLSELVKRACAEGPQEITLRGEPTAIVMSLKEFKKLKADKPSLLAFMQASPLKDKEHELEIDLTRDKSLTRDVAL